MGRHHARAGIIGQTDAGDLALRHVAARLLAVAPFRPYFRQKSDYKSLVTGAREAAVVCSGGSVRSYHIPGAISWRCCAYIPRVSYCAAVGERAGVVC